MGWVRKVRAAVAVLVVTGPLPVTSAATAAQDPRAGRRRLGRRNRGVEAGYGATMSRLTGLASVLVCALLTSLLSAAAPTPAVGAPAKTVIKVRVVGCEGCRVQPVQIKKGDVTYWGPEKTVPAQDARVRFRVPTTRTQAMTFLVYAPFDQWAQDGIPLTPITRFKAKSAGDPVRWPYARKKHRASACWSGTTRSTVRNTLVVKQVTVGGKATAGGFFKRTMPSGKYWYSVRKASLHPADPSICP
jgi:hypothetical protein